MSTAGSKPASLEFGESADGNKLIMFTPGQNDESRDECDIIINRYGGSMWGLLESPDPSLQGWWFEPVVGLAFNVFVPERAGEILDTQFMSAFSHLAISYKGGAHVVAVKIKEIDRWYLTAPHAK